MKYYSSDDKDIVIGKDDYFFGHGSFGRIYPYKNNQCIKIFNESTCVHDYDVLNEIKNLHLYHFDAIKDFIYDENGHFSGYIMPRYNLYITDFYSMSTEEFLRIYRRLLANVQTLTDRHIFLYDMCLKNTTGYRGDIKMIDYDLYRHTKSPTLSSSNYRQLINFWYELFVFQRIQNGYQKDISEKDISRIFKPYSDDPYTVIDDIKGEEYVFYAIRKR
jgi:hypothetical protein